MSGNKDFWSGRYKLTFSDLINMYDTQPLVAVSPTGDDAMVQDNGYSLDWCISMYRNGYSFYIDDKKDSSLPAWLGKVGAING